MEIIQEIKIDEEELREFLNLMEITPHIKSLLKSSVDILQRKVRRVFFQSIIKGQFYTDYFDIPIQPLKKWILLTQNNKTISFVKPVILHHKEFFKFEYDSGPVILSQLAKNLIFIVTSRLYHDPALEENYLLNNLENLLSLLESDS